MWAAPAPSIATARKSAIVRSPLLVVHPIPPWQICPKWLGCSLARTWQIVDAGGLAKLKVSSAKYVNQGIVAASWRLLYQLGNASGATRTAVPYQPGPRLPRARA